MQKNLDLFSDGSVEFNKKLTRLGCFAKKLLEETQKRGEDINFDKMEPEDCVKCRGNRGDQPRRPHIRDLCPAEKEKIAQLVEKLAECNQGKYKAEAELAEMRSEKEALLSRYEIRCNEHEVEKSQLKQELDSSMARAQSLKDQSSRSLDALGEQLTAQEQEFVRLKDTVRDLLREKINLQNALIERESRVKISEAKLERAKETLEMEKLLFMKEHVKDSVIRTMHNRGCQTLDDEDDVKPAGQKSLILNERNSGTSIKCKDDLEDPSRDAILLRSLFFKSNTYDDDDDENSPLNLLCCPTKSN